MIDTNLDPKLQLRAITSLVKELDEENKDVWALLDIAHDVEKCFLDALRKYHSNDEILKLMRASKIPESKIKDMAQYFSENELEPQ